MKEAALAPVAVAPPPGDNGVPSPVAWCPSSDDPADPVATGRCDLARALGIANLTADVDVLTAEQPAARAAMAMAAVTLDARAESFVVLAAGGRTLVIGRDATGAMYGAQALADLITERGQQALPLAAPLTGAPALAVRAANPFLVLPAAGESSWWFRDLDFWRQYLNALGHARINFLDLHGMYSVESTIFPNALLYFATSATFPDVGVAATDRQRNLDALRAVVAMAAARGIRVGLMSYRADTSPGGGPDQMLTDDADVKLYTREAVADLARRVPGLARIGFRIGESAREASWYNDTFVAGVHDAGTGVGLATRTWGANKPDILNIVRAAGEDTIVEAKFNGEHLGAPYAVAGGLVSTSIGGYSYQDFLTPPMPYQFVFQLRAGGTHRIFRYASFERTRRTVAALALSPAVRGFTLEPAHAYYPMRDFYHAERGDRFSDWTFRRDELAYLLFGRLGYDPQTPERFFRRALADRVGTDALWDAMQAASDIVPWMQTAHTCGLDSRDAAPELELGGDVGYWASPAHTAAPQSACGQHQAMDSFAVALPADAADDLVAGVPTTRLRPVDVARLLLADATAARAAPRGAATAMLQPEARDIARECQALADLGLYFAHKLRAATALAVYARSGRADYLAAAQTESDASGNARRMLINETRHIAAFPDHLRMAALGLPTFHWSRQADRLGEDAAAIKAIVNQVATAPPAAPGAATLPPAMAWLDAARADGPGLRELVVTPRDPTAARWNVVATLATAPPAGARVRILWKPFHSQSDWQAVDAHEADGTYSATVVGGGAGALFAVEISAPDGGWRYPDVTLETPYRVLAP